MDEPCKAFKQRVKAAIANPTLQIALDGNAERRKAVRLASYQSLPEGFEAVRAQARAIRQETIQHLDPYLAQFCERLQANGMIVHHAADAHAAQRIVLEIVQAHGARTVVKSKTMVGEEVHINRALEEAGINAVETDLGEYIVQLRHEPPAHIITPAVHLRREDVAQLFHEELGMPYTTDVKVMTDTARRVLRSAFLKAGVGITGVNLGVAQSGTLVLCSNEGNARMCTTLPPVHIALMGVERLVPTLADMAVILRLLSRSATGQKLTNYVSLIQSPRKKGDEDGAIERHVILLDNGRLRIAQGEMNGMLQCIRCGACLNICPVFREIGGHAYGSVYPGPIGALVSSAFFGIGEYGHLAKASSLCGACAEVCPVGVDFPTLLLRTRDEYIQQAPLPLIWRMGMKVYGWMAARSWAFHLAEKMGAWGMRLLPHYQGWVKWLPSLASAWTASRDFPPFAGKPFHERMKSGISAKYLPPKPLKLADNMPPSDPISVQTGTAQPLLERFTQEWQNLGGEFFSAPSQALPEVVLAWLKEQGIQEMLAWREEASEDTVLRETLLLLKRAGVTLREPFRHPAGEEYTLDAGLSGATCALADSGTLVVPGGGERILQASLMAPIHLAVLNAEHIHATMSEWLSGEGSELVINNPNTVLISGPSRTADIEMTLTIGMHGPERVVIFCYT